MSIPYLSCMALVAHLYALPPRVLPSIQAVEGGSAGTVRPDTNGTADLGVMQVNTSWIPALEAYTTLPAVVVRDRLISRPCFNIAAAGAIMRTYLDQAHGNLLRAVGYYHSHTAMLGEEYRREVLRAARLLFESGKPGQ
jgi:Transglycosylase SLT domain